MLSDLVRNASFQLDAALTLIVLLIAVLPGRRDFAALVALEEALRRAAARPALSLAAVAAMVGLLRIALLPLLPFPEVVGRDESSLLLQAQTFAAGHLANPAHPFGRFFESVYVHQSPSYGSMYFPGRGLELALGLALFGAVGAGVLIVLALAAAALVWMLRGWLSPGLAFVGGLLFVAKFGLFGNLMNQPIGLAAPVLAGALILGAFPRLLRRVRWLDAILLALGLALGLVNRPFETVLFCAPLAAVLAWRLVALLRDGAFAPAARLALPAVLAVAGAATLLAAYDSANTGDPLRPPYAMNRADYAGTPAFLFQAAAPPTRAQPAPLRQFYALEGESYYRYRSPTGLAQSAVAKLKNLWSYFVGPALTLPFLLGLGWLWRRPALFASGGLLFAGFCLTQFNWAHYLLPALGLVLLVTMAGLARLRASPRGLFLSRALPLIPLAGWTLPLATLTTGQPGMPATVYAACCYLEVPYARRVIERQLAQAAGRDLVIVRYRPGDSAREQWVFNDADIDRAPIIWAHDMGDAENRRLLARYPDRRHWLIDGVPAARVMPYEVGPPLRP